MGANLKEVRERIKSVQSTQQITKAMKMVSAAKLKRAQDAITNMRPYANKLGQMLKNILSSLDGDTEISYGKEREVKKVAIVLVTSNRGLAGAFNSNLIKRTIKLMEEKYAKQLASGDITLFFIGKKGADYFKKRSEDFNVVLNREYVQLFDDLSFDNIVQVPNFLMEAFNKGDFDAIEIVYSFFKNPAIQEPTAFQFLPVPKNDEEEEEEANKSKIVADYIFEPSKETLLENLVPSILQTQFQKCILDTHASEHGARMTAMDQATDNAGELIKDLRIVYNKARQEAITKEISEIVGGAAALNG